MKKAVPFIIPLAVCFVLGFISSQLQQESLVSWYPALNKPSLTPPDFVFPVAWGIIYVLMSVSIGIVWNTRRRERSDLVVLFAAQLALNFLWSILFFRLQNPLLGLFDIMALEFLIVAYILTSSKVSKPAAWLFVPYALWVGFAAYLNAYIYAFN